MKIFYVIETVASISDQREYNFAYAYAKSHFEIRILDHSQNYAFILHLVAFHFICITFAFHLHFA